MTKKYSIICFLIALLSCQTSLGQTGYVFGGERSEVEAGLSEAFAQAGEIDTSTWKSRFLACESALRNEENYRSLTGSLARIYEAYERLGDLGGCERCIQALQQISEQTGDHNPYLQSKILEANTEFSNKKIKKGLDILKEAEAYLLEKEDNHVLTRLYLKFSDAFERASDYSICMKYIQKAIYNVDYTIQDPLLHCEAYLHTARLFLANEDYKSAWPYIKGADKICEVEGYRKLAARVCLAKGEYLRKKKYPQMANAYCSYARCIEIMLSDDVENEPDNADVLTKAYIGIAQTLLEQNNLEEARPNIDKALEQCRKGDGFGNINETYLTYGKYFEKMMQADSAQHFYELAFNNAMRGRAYPLMRDAAINLLKIMQKEKNWEKAFKYSQIAYDANEIIVKNQSSKEMISWEINSMTEVRNQQKDMEVKQSKDKEQASKSVATASALLTILTMGLLVVVAVQFRKNKKKNRLLEEKTKELEENKLELEETAQKLREQQEEMRLQSEKLSQQNSELEKLSLVAKQTDNSIFLTDVDGNIIWLNEAFTRHSGYKIEDYLSQNNNSLIVASSNPDIRKHLMSIKETKEPVTYTSATTNKHGDKVWIHTNLTPVLDSGGNISMFIAVCSDITNLKNAQEKIAMQNIEINESMECARKIQNSLQAPKKFKDFVLGSYMEANKPKNIVSGDFNWIYYKNDKTLFLQGDCTGHGIPGVTLSMMEYVMLNMVMASTGDNFTAAQILNKLRHINIRNLHQGGRAIDSQDGMDASMFVFDRQTMTLNYAAGFSIAYILKFGKPDEATMRMVQYNNCSIVEQEGRDAYLVKLRPNRFPVGGHPKDYIPFDDRIFNVNDGDIVYASSDGYIDQFGGPNNKKFSTVNFERLILEICHLPMDEQREHFLRTFNEWKGTNEQTDDMNVFAVQLRKNFEYN